MKRLDAWFVTASALAERRVLLEDSLLSGTLARYARYRLQIFAVAQLVAYAVYLLEFGLLRGIFQQRHLTMALGLLNASLAVTGFWWGALELARSRIRQSTRPDRARRELTPWLTAACLVGLVPLASAAALTGFKVFVRHGVFSVFDLWTLACLSRLLTDLVAQSFYAGAYAIRRVYRPLWIPPVLRAVGFASVLGLWPWLGPWSFGWGYLLSGLLSSGVTFVYARATYRALRVEPPRLLRVRHFRVPKRPSLESARFVVAAGLAGLSMRLSAMLVLAFFLLDGGRGRRLLPLAFVIHLMSPLLNATGAWAQTFYFDWKRLDHLVLATFRERFGAFLARLAWSSGSLCWLFAMPVLIGFAHQHGLVLGFLALPLFLLRARVAVLQVKYFAEERFGWLVATTGLTLSALACGVVAWRNESPDLEGLESLLFLTALVAAQLLILRALDRPQVRGESTRSLDEWVETLAAVRGPVVVGVGELASAVSARAVLTQLETVLGENVALHDRTRFVWHAAPHAQEAELVARLCVASAGLVEHVRLLPARESGTAALQAALAAGLVDRGQEHPDLAAEFASRFPQGLCIDVAGARFPAALARLPLLARRGIWREAKRAALGLPKARHGSDYEVSVFAPSGRIGVIFLLERGTSPEERIQWRKRVTEASRAETLRRALLHHA